MRKDVRFSPAGPRFCLTAGPPAVTSGDVSVKNLFEFTSHPLHDGQRLCWRGELDLAGAETARSALHRAIESEAPLIVVDLAGLTFIDASGRGVLASAHEAQTARGGRLLVTNAGPTVSRTFKLVGLDQLLAI